MDEPMIRLLTFVIIATLIALYVIRLSKANRSPMGPAAVPHLWAGNSVILAAAQRLLEKTHAGTRSIRRLGVSLSGLESARASDPQLELFSSRG